MKRVTVSERALILAPRGRDSQIAANLLGDAGIDTAICPSLRDLIARLDDGAGFVVLTEEALSDADLGPLMLWLSDQQEWSDLPFVLLTRQGGGLERNPAAKRHLDILGNVTFIERPFHPTTFVSLAQAALRGRRRQYEARARLAALHEGELRYRTLFEIIDEGFCIIEFLDGPHGPLSDYVHVEANPAHERHSGIARVVGQKVRDLVPDEADGWVQLYRQVLISGEPIRFERELVATHRHLELAAFRVEPESRRQVAVLFQDVTARRKAQHQLQELNDTLERRVAERTAESRLLARIVETTDDQIQALDLDFRWLAINSSCAAAYERIYGKRPRVDDNLLDTFANMPEHRNTLEAMWRRALAGESYTSIRELGDSAFDRRAYDLRFEILRDSEGRQIGAFLTGRDISERLGEQARLAQAEEALRQAQKMEALGQLTGGVAHDFNNLLTIIKSSTELMRRQNLTEERRRRYVDAISDTVDRAAKLTSQLLAFARRQALKPEVFEPAARVQTITDMLRTIVGSRIRVVLEVDCRDCFVMADVSQFETALVNMAVNARDAMDGEGTLTIRVGEAERLPPIRDHAGGPGRYIAVSLEDTGHGIPPDRLTQIFEPFFTTKEVGKGTGLGLSQVFGFAKQSGGDVDVQSEENRGTRFTLYLPLQALPGAVPTMGDADSREPERADAGRGRRILVVEDNADVGAFSTQLLRDLGYETAWAANAAQALAVLRDGHAFDAVFSDVVMPGMSGIELGRELRRLYPDLPFVLTSGYSQVLSEEGRHGFELLQKPYAVDALSAVLQRVMLGRARHGGG